LAVSSNLARRPGGSEKLILVTPSFDWDNAVRYYSKAEGVNKVLPRDNILIPQSQSLGTCIYRTDTSDPRPALSSSP
jgi:hypothetical protein